MVSTAIPYAVIFGCHLHDCVRYGSFLWRRSTLVCYVSHSLVLAPLATVLAYPVEHHVNSNWERSELPARSMTEKTLWLLTDIGARKTL